MMVHIKRLVSFILALVLTMSLPLYTYADNSGVDGPPGGLIIPSKGGKPGGVPVFNEYGFRITLADATPILDANVPSLPETFTIDDLNREYYQIKEITKTRYWEPGSYGLNFYSQALMTNRPAFVKDSTIPAYEIRPGIKMDRADSQKAENDLAWMIWDTPEGTDRTLNVKPYTKAVYDTVFDQALAGDPGTWSDTIRQHYNNAGGVLPRTFIESVVGNGVGIVQAFSYATWSTHEPNCNPGNAYQRVSWSQLGHLAMCLQLAWAAKDIGDVYTYETFINKTAAWVSSGFQVDLMPIIMVEATQAFNLDNNTRGGETFNTLPSTLSFAYRGQGIAEKLFLPWAEGAKDNTTQAIMDATGGQAPSEFGQKVMGQGMNGYPMNGQWHDIGHGPRPTWHDRNLLKRVGPQDDLTKNYGYFVNWTYLSGMTPPPPDTDEENAFGSFTWKLTPDGVHDKTPEKEVNESSTIYELNISQDNYNANNYQKWNSVVRADGIDCNKLRIRIYHISENLAEEQPATKYARDSVKQKGAEVTTPVNKVTISPTGNITGFPAGTIITPFSTPF